MLICSETGPSRWERDDPDHTSLEKETGPDGSGRDILVNMFLYAYCGYICIWPESCICINTTREEIIKVVVVIIMYTD